MSQTPIFTIGYGARDITTFVAALQNQQIAYLIDVRSKPYSRYKPDFSKQALEEHLKKASIRYVFMGDTLGGQPEDPACYTDGKVSYEKVEQQLFYRQGIGRLRQAWQQQLRVAIMCSEGKPEQCHRSKLIGKTLAAEGIPMLHIDENDQLIDQQAVILRLHEGQTSLLREEPYATLKQVFGFDEFRPMQADVVQNILQKQDTLAVMPTGSGKSLCYQLPALLFPGLTVVVSPLISLMQDQVEQLRELGITAVFLNSTLTHSQYQQTTHQIRNGAAKLLYAAPETLLRPETLLLLEQCPVDCLTIDEAHCISEWGHDFRPEYRQLADMRHRLPQAVCLAVTATATEQVRRDIKSSLNIGAAGEFIASFNRENLHLAVQPRTDGLGQVTSFLETHRGESGIIYCTTRKQVDILTNQLAALGWPVLPYHAGMDDQTRQQHQRQFSQDDVPIMVATIAFGMGINKSNVRFIVHYDLPKNLESYYQQIGRAGRDGLPADCLLLYSPSDVQTIYHFMQQQEPERQKVAHLHLQAMLGFVETTVCRRRPLLTYFGESYTADSCNTCDNCLTDEAAPDDLTLPAQKFLSCVKRTGEFFGVNHIIDVLRGSQSQAVLAKGHDKLTTYNIGGEFSKKEWQYLARQFVQLGLLTQDMEFGSLKLTSKAYEVFKGGAVHGLLPNHELSGRPKPGSNYDMALFELLRAKRKVLADENDVPPFMVLSDRSLMEMAMYLPQTEPALAELHGLGQFKVQKYGEAFLAVIRPYCSEHNLTERRKTAVSTPATTRKNRTEEVVEWYNNGRSIPQIAEMFAVKQATIIEHLWKAVQNGQSIRPDNLLQLSQLPPEAQTRAISTFTQLGLERLRPVFDALGETVSFDELHLIRLYIATRERSY